MAKSIQDRISRLEDQFREIMKVVEGVGKDLDVDRGVAKRSYSQKSDFIHNNKLTVKNISRGLKPPAGVLLRFNDAQDKEYGLPAGAATTVTGLTTGIQRLIDRGYLAKI